jgi:hypothetical protein
VKARNLEGYGDWSMPSDIAVPLDPNRFHFPLEVHIGSRLSSVRLGQVKVAKETTLEEARHIIFDQMGAVNDGIRQDLSGNNYLSQEPFQARTCVENLAPHSFAFTRGDCDRRTVTIPKTKVLQRLWCSLSVVLWCSLAVVLACCGARFLWCCGARLLWCSLAVVLACCGARLLWRHL